MTIAFNFLLIKRQYVLADAENVFFHTANLFNLEVDLIFYDTTTASFSVDMEDDGDRYKNTTLRKYGHAKEGLGHPRLLLP